ncbi:hypothetical protein SKAU_G00182770 [Synaphobranchus kaupii]|uniref:Uncharacterized protein n=1 Tax=Synaphobranchus kaupii TaxID=118154 RepID=A0A9Q1FCF5_SYNKA|nr:hypothetical protein SKAU_G00182770 [Synaphobranchus kaupii]
MAWIIAWIILTFTLIFQSAGIPQFGNNTCHVSVYRGEEQNSFDTDLANLVGLGPGLGNPNRPSEINSEAFVEETSFARGSRGLKSLSSADGLIENGPADKCSRPGFAALKRFFRQTLERVSAYVREETSFARGSGSLKSPSSADGLIENGPADKCSKSRFVTMIRFFRRTLERFSAYVRELVSQLVFGLGTRDQTRPREIHFSDKHEALLEIENGPADKYSKSRFVAIICFFRRTLERFSTYVREEISFGPGRRFLKFLYSADGRIENGPADKSSRPGFAALKLLLYKTMERFYAYLRDLIGILAEEWQLDTALQGWNCRVLAILASVEAAIIIVTFFIAQCFVNYQNCKKLQEEQKQTRSVERKVKDLELELEIYEREWANQERELIIVHNLLDTINSKCQERKHSLAQKQTGEREDARIIKAQESSKWYKRKMKEKHQTNLVSIQEASLSLDIRETEKICKLLSQVKTTLLEMLFKDQSLTAEQEVLKVKFPAPRKERRGAQTDAD